MSDLTGSITSVANKFNKLPNSAIIEGIKQAVYLDRKISEAEVVKKNEPKKEVAEKNVTVDMLKGDMYRNIRGEELEL